MIAWQGLAATLVRDGPSRHASRARRPPTPVPEPSAAVLLVLGFVTLSMHTPSRQLAS